MRKSPQCHRHGFSYDPAESEKFSVIRFKNFYLETGVTTIMFYSNKLLTKAKTIDIAVSMTPCNKNVLFSIRLHP